MVARSVNDGNIGDVRIFRQVQTSRRIIIIILVLLIAIGVILVVVDLSFMGASTPPFIFKESEITRKVIESVTT
jgi:hypothetical protein